MGPTWEYSSYYKAKTSSHTWTDRNSEWMPHWLKPGMPNIHNNQLFIFWFILSHKGVKVCVKQVPLYFKLFYHLSWVLLNFYRSRSFLFLEIKQKHCYFWIYTQFWMTGICAKADVHLHIKWLRDSKTVINTRAGGVRVSEQPNVPSSSRCRRPWN